MLATGYLYDFLRKIGLSDFGARTGEFMLVRPLKVVLILIAAALIGRLASRAIAKWIRALPQRAPLRDVSGRAERRAVTLGAVLGSTARVVIWSVAVLMVFDEMGVNLAPLLAGAGIAGVAVGFGAQSLVRDFLSGLFILVEDQYGVGDSVDVGAASGTVEEVNLRVTRLRSVEGTVWYVPNGEIRRVANSSIEGSRAVVDVAIPRQVDVALALRIAEEEARAFASDATWASAVIAEPEVWGVDSMTFEEVIVRVVVRTVPTDRLRVARALRGRIAARVQQESGSGRAA
jgi:small-conductance mechanosensitive channel